MVIINSAGHIIVLVPLVLLKVVSELRSESERMAIEESFVYLRFSSPPIAEGIVLIKNIGNGIGDNNVSISIDERVIPVIVIVIVGEASYQFPIVRKSMLVFQVDVGPVICRFRSGSLKIVP